MRYTATKIPADQQTSGWYAIYKSGQHFPMLTETIKTDYLVIGAGFAGLSAAKRLLEGGAKDITIIDAQKIAWGAAGRNSGFMIDVPHHLSSKTYAGQREQDLREIIRNRYAIDIAKSTAQQYGLQQVLSPIGKINAAADKAGQKALQSYTQYLDSLDEFYTCYDQTQLKDVLGIDYYQAGIHTPGCVLVQPVAYIRGVAAGLSSKVSIYENSPAMEIISGSPHTVITPSGKIEANNIMLTVNGHLNSFGLYQRQLMHMFLYASMTNQLTDRQLADLGGDREWGIVPAHPCGSSLRKLSQGRILVRNHITYNPNMDCSYKQFVKAKQRHIVSFKNRFPMLADVQMEYSWSGHLCLSLNSVPAWGEIDRRIFSACCQNGLGAVQGTLSGTVLADLVMQKENAFLQDFSQQNQPQKLYAEPFMSLGAKTRIWWEQKKAGRDL